ncbi:hypothetical protein MXB_22 [Myxobolus squamalis]|nr:hypothetical protein MXB_22 [Myxobolus squamalis]
MPDPSEYEFGCLTTSMIDSLVNLIRECFPVAYSSESITNLITEPRNYTEGVFYQKNLVGMIVGRVKSCSQLNYEDLKEDNEFSNLPKTCSVCYLMLIGVTDNHRHNKIGSILLKNFTQHALKNNCQAIYLHTHSENEAAMNFYKNHNFNYSHTIQAFYNFYDKDQPANLMYQILPEPHVGLPWYVESNIINRRFLNCLMDSFSHNKN